MIFVALCDTHASSRDGCNVPNVYGGGGALMCTCSVSNRRSTVDPCRITKLYCRTDIHAFYCHNREEAIIKQDVVWWLGNWKAGIVRRNERCDNSMIDGCCAHSTRFN